MFEATIKAETLKRVVYPLFRLNGDGMFKIDPNGITCQAVNPENTEIAEVIMPAEAWDSFTAQARTVGIDLKWMMAILNVTPDGVPVDMCIDRDRLYLNIGMHRPSRRLLDPSKIRKSLKNYERSYTVLMGMLGGFFVAMIKYLAAGDALGLEIRAYKDDVQFDSTYAIDDDPRHYHLGVDCLIEYSGDARGVYGIEYLVDIAAGIQNDKVSLQFGKDTPIEIGYDVDGCKIKHTLAPRIDDDDEVV